MPDHGRRSMYARYQVIDGIQKEKKKLEANIFYIIGHALGIHAENEVDEVNEVMEFYDLVPDEVIEVRSYHLERIPP
jgi:sulfite reductase alpha subunit-like flavoprotein